MKRRNFLGYGCLFLGGCALAQTSSSDVSSNLNKPSELRFAVTDLSGLEELQQDFEPFRATFEEILEIPITFYPVENYSAAAPALLANDLDIVMAGPSEYLILSARAQAEPLVEVSRPNYYSLIVTRSDSGLKNLTDLKGKTIAMKTEGSTAGHIFPMKLLIEAGLDPETDFQIKMLNRDSFDALMAGEVEAWATSQRFYQEYVEDPGLTEQITILKRGERLPGDVFVANPSLGSEFIKNLQTQMINHQETLREALAATEANAKYRDSEIFIAQDNNYDDMRDIYRTIGQESAIQ